MKRPPQPAMALSLITAALLVACNHDDHDSAVEVARVAISGVVADGPLQGAKACYDLNGNLACDPDEPVSGLTDANGKYTLSVAESDAGKHAVVADVPATAIDKDSGAAVGADFTLTAPASGNSGAQEVFVSALTTAVVDIARDSGKSVAEATAQVQASLNLAVSPLADFTAASGDAGAALAAKALTAVVIETHKLAAAHAVPPLQTAALVRAAGTTQLEVLATALATSTGANAAAKAADAVAAVKGELNLSAATVAAVADAMARPAGTPDAPGPFVSLRRFAYTDANSYSYTVFTGDNSKTDASGSFTANEIREAQVAGAGAPFNRNQAYWTGSAWQTCELQWEVST